MEARQIEIKIRDRVLSDSAEELRKRYNLEKPQESVDLSNFLRIDDLHLPLPITDGGTGAGTRQQALTNLGFKKLLWQGAWSSGSITVSGFDEYTYFDIRMVDNATKILAIKYGTSLRGIGGRVGTDGIPITSYISTIVSGNVLTFQYCGDITPRPFNTNGGFNNRTVAEIIGIV